MGLVTACQVPSPQNVARAHQEAGVCERVGVECSRCVTGRSLMTALTTQLPSRTVLTSYRALFLYATFPLFCYCVFHICLSTRSLQGAFTLVS